MENEDTSHTKCTGGKKYQSENGNTKTGTTPEIAAANNMACNGVVYTLYAVMFSVSLSKLEESFSLGFVWYYCYTATTSTTGESTSDSALLMITWNVLLISMDVTVVLSSMMMILMVVLLHVVPITNDDIVVVPKTSVWKILSLLIPVVWLMILTHRLILHPLHLHLHLLWRGWHEFFGG